MGPWGHPSAKQLGYSVAVRLRPPDTEKFQSLKSNALGDGCQGQIGIKSENMHWPHRAVLPNLGQELNLGVQ